MNRFKKQPDLPPKKIQVDIYQDFQGNKAELLLLKLSGYISEYRKNIFLSFGIFALIVLVVVIYMEYHADQVQKASVVLEELQEKNIQNPNRELKEMIAEFEKVRKDFSTGETELRTSKILADLHARNGEFAKAAELMESAGTSIDDLREVKAFYFYVAGNYREQGNDLKKSLADYETASGLLNNMRNVPTMLAWTYFQTGRMYYLNGNQEKSKEYLKKVLDIDGSSGQFQKARELATYLLLKINQS